MRQQYIHAVDIVPTVYDLLGIEPPGVIKGYTQSPIEGESFAAALTDPTVPGKSTQFYTMLGQRSIYHEGWLACTVHPPIGGWGKFELDEWELYDLEHDRAQSKNVAADHPEQLETLKSLWFYYAGIYNGLPLDDRTALEQVLAERPRGGPDRSSTTYYPDTADVPESAGVAINGRSYTIAAGVEIDSADAEGVLFAHGGVAGGHSLYVKDKKLRYTFNWIGTKMFDDRRRHRHHAGQARLTAEFAAKGPTHRPDDARIRRHALALPRHDQGRRGRDRHPARQLLPRRRRPVHRTRQRVTSHARVHRALPVHRRHHRQGRRRRLGREVRRSRGPSRRLVQHRLSAGQGRGPAAAGGSFIVSSCCVSGASGTLIGPRVGRSRSAVMNSRKATTTPAISTPVRPRPTSAR